MKLAGFVTRNNFPWMLCLILLSISSSQAEIVEINHFNEIHSHLSPDTLLILDIDDTLLVPSQMLGCDEWFIYHYKKYHSEGMPLSQAFEKGLADWESIRHLTQMELVEPETDRILKSLQEQDYCIMGLTTQGLSLATRTSQQLKSNGIDLTQTAPSKEDHYFLLDDHGILFRNGILFTSGQSKGKALFTLCEHLDFYPKRIVFINDKASHLQDIENTAHEYQVAFTGLRYAYSDMRKAAFRPEIAELQFKLSTFAHLLSDEEAATLMQSLDARSH